MNDDTSVRNLLVATLTQESDEGNRKETHDGADDAEPWDIFMLSSQPIAKRGQCCIITIL